MKLICFFFFTILINYNYVIFFINLKQDMLFENI